MSDLPSHRVAPPPSGGSRPLLRTGLAACLLLLAVTGPGRRGAAAGQADPVVPPPAARGEVILPSGRVLQVEIADTPARRARGYMFRKRIGDTEGMVFLMDELGFHPFWMKNCFVALDILWLDEAWKVVHIERDLPPCRGETCPSYTPMQASRFALEVRAGLAAREGLKLGDRITYQPPR